MLSAERHNGAAFETLLVPVLAPAYHLARSLTRDASEAEDLVQEAALQAFRGFASFALGSNFKAWFYRILTNCFYARHRKARRQPRPATAVELDASDNIYLWRQLAAAGLHTTSEDPATTLMTKMTSEQIHQAMAELPEEFRVVVVLHFIDELRYQDIAEIVQCPVGTVRSRLHRGRKILQEKLWQIARESGIVEQLLGIEDPT